MKNITPMIVALLVAATACNAIEYKKSVVSGPGGTTRSTIHTFYSTSTIGGSNMTSVTSAKIPKNVRFDDLDWSDKFPAATLDERIRNAEQKLYKLYFMRDVCRTLEDEITIAFEKTDIREVIKKISVIRGTDLPCEIPEGEFMVEKSDVTGMPLDHFLSSVATACGLVLQYAPDKLLFVKPE